MSEHQTYEAVTGETKKLHPLPHGWEWRALGEICQINPGKEKTVFTDNDKCTFVPMAAVSDIEGAIISPETRSFKKIKSGYTQFRDRDVIFAKITPCMENGKIAIVSNMTNGIGYGSTEFYVIRCSEKVLPKYIYRFVRSSTFRQKAKAHMKGAVGQQRVPKEFLIEYPFPLPPLDEQKRIVARLDSMLGKIKEARRLIQEARDTFAERRAAILARAFRGELTAKWREENPDVEPAEKLLERIRAEREKEEAKSAKKGKVKFSDEPIEEPYPLPEGWKWARALEIADHINGYAFKSREFKPKGIQVLRIGNIYNSILDRNRSPVFVSDTIDKSTKQRVGTVPGDIIMTLTGTKYKQDYGNTAVITSKEPLMLVNQRLLLIRPAIHAEYLNWHFQTPSYRKIFFQSETGGVNQGNVSSRATEQIPIPLAPESEQKELIRVISSIFAAEDESIKNIAYDLNLDLIETALLKKAFRGELS